MSVFISDKDTANLNAGLAQGFFGAGPLHFLKKKNQIKKYTFSNKRNLWWNKNIRLADLAEASKFMIDRFRSYINYMVSLKMTIFIKLHALSRRLSVAFSPARWCSICNIAVFFHQR